MKNAFRAVALVVLLVASPALAQWQTPNHSVPIGRGGGVTGFGSAAPSVAGRPFVDNGASADPSFGTIGNSGFTVGSANTVKGTLDGVSTTDLSLPSCTGVNQAWRYVSGTGINCGTVSVQTGYNMPINFGLSSSAAGNALTITLTQANGSAPSSTNPVLVPFRSTTLTTGTVTWDTITASTSLTIPSGATLGTSSSNVAFRVWIFLEHNGGSPELAVATCSNTTTTFPCASWETTLKTSTTISSGATSAGVLYAGTGVAADAVRIVGFCDFASGLTTAGTWASSCTTLQMMGPGVNKPGSNVQVAYGGNNTSVNFTPTSTANLVSVVDVTNAQAGGSGFNGTILIKRGSTTIQTFTTVVAANTNIGQTFSIIDAPNSVSAVTYSINSTTSTGSVSLGFNNFIFMEIMGALDEPANDNPVAANIMTG